MARTMPYFLQKAMNWFSATTGAGGTGVFVGSTVPIVVQMTRSSSGGINGRNTPRAAIKSV